MGTPQFYTEHTVKLADGIDIYYTDSGAPSSGDYTTLVVLHGSAFHGAVFIPLHEFAHRSNLRVILWNRRDYHGSTKYTDEELDDIKAGRQIYQDRLAFQLASFFEHFITTKGTPKLSSDRKTGGFILMGWSFGNATAMSLLANPKAVPKPLYELIEPYIMSIVLHDPPYSSLGFPLTTYAGIYDPFNDPDYTTPEQVYENFKHWVTSYYKHPDITVTDGSRLDYRKRTEERTMNKWSDEEKIYLFDTVAAVRTELPSYAPPMQVLLKKQTDKVFFNENLVTSHFPSVHIFYLVCGSSVWFCMWAYMETMRLHKEAKNRKQIVRATSFHSVDGANHFLGYEMPELMLQYVIAGSRREFEG